MTKFQVKQEIWVWKNNKNVWGMIVEVLEQDHKFSSGDVLEWDQYIVGFPVPGIGDYVYELLGEYALHEFPHCRVNGYHACQQNIDVEIERLQALINNIENNIESNLKSIEWDKERLVLFKEHVERLRLQKDSLTSTENQAEKLDTIKKS